MTDRNSKLSRGLWFTSFINVLVFLFLLSLLEGAARLYIAFTRGIHSAGLTERTVYLSYKPFVMYGPDWDQFIWMEEVPGNSDICRILLVGGSTAQGFPNALLEKELNKAFASRKFHVFNAAYGGYEARQQVIVASLWGPKVFPDVILSLDGANDLSHRLRVRKPGAFYLNETYELFLGKPFLAPMYYLLGQSQLYNGMMRFWQKRNIQAAEAYVDAIPPYVDAQHSLNVIAKGLRAKRLMVLQPFSSFKNPQSGAEAAFDLYKYREQQMKSLYQTAHDGLGALAERDRVPYLDSREIYDGISDTVFTDDVHLTELGYQILAERIAVKFQNEVISDDLICGGEGKRLS
jgi:lysophospholipase L1-like esterase